MEEQEYKLTNQLLKEAVLEIEAAQNRVADMKARFTQLYGVGPANLLKEALEQRAIAAEATEYAEALLSAPDMPEEED